MQALTLHGRTRAQMYTGEADWTLIGQVKNHPDMHIPVIGNGDITSAQEAQQAFDRYGVDAVMIGRATFGRPWIFHEIVHPEAPYSLDDKIDVLKQQATESVQRIGEYRGILHVRRHLAATPIFKGIPDFRETRIRMLRADTVESLFSVIEETRELLHRLGQQ